MGRLSEAFRWLLYDTFRWWALAMVALAALPFVMSLTGDLDASPLHVLGAAVFWVVIGGYWARQARAAKRHRELRERRLERERQGLAPRRG